MVSISDIHNMFRKLESTLMRVTGVRLSMRALPQYSPLTLRQGHTPVCNKHNSTVVAVQLSTTTAAGSSRAINSSYQAKPTSVSKRA